MSKITLVANNGKQYDAHIMPTGYGMAEVTFYEVKNPNCKNLFRTKFFPTGSKCFWVEDFDTIQQGVEYCFFSVLEEKEKEEELRQKWKEFESEVK